MKKDNRTKTKSKTTTTRIGCFGHSSTPIGGTASNRSSSSDSVLSLRQTKEVVHFCPYLRDDSSSSLHSTFTVNSPISSPAAKVHRHSVLDECGDSTSIAVIASHDDKSSASSASRPTTTTRRTVSFNENVDVKETIHVNDFTDEEYQLYWISHSEQDVIMNMAEITTELMAIGAFEDEEHICFRGLEGKTPEATLEYSDMYLNLVEALIYEQELCRASPDGRINYEHIAALYGEWTQTCKEIAWHRGQLDEHEVRQQCSRADTMTTFR
jgi:hypothetical protein